MLINVLLWVLTKLAGVFVAILPNADFWPLPSGLTDSLSWISSQIGQVGAILPSGTLANLFAALTLVVAVQLFVLPWVAARNFRLPFRGK